jgi:hypothetical protein
MSKKLFANVLILISMGSFIACNPINEIKKTIKDTGHIMFPNPMEDARTGTLVAGTPKHLQFIAPHDACFPNGIPGLRVEDNTNIPQKYHSYSFSGGAKADLLDILGVGTGVIGAGIDYHYAKEVNLEMEGVKIEYFDSIILAKYFRGELDQTMSQACKDYLQYTGFVTQALKVDKLKFTFLNKHGVAMNINPKMVEVFLNLGIDLSYHVENHTTLVIDTPKYIGFVLGRFKPEDNGVVLYRASKVRWNKFVFKSIDMFGGSNMFMTNRSFEPYDGYDNVYFFEDEYLDEEVIDNSSVFKQ